MRVRAAEMPPRVSIYDVIGLITGYTASNSAHMYDRLVVQFPEVCATCTNFKFPGRGQRDTPVTDAEGIVTIIMLLPGRTAAMARQYAANVLVRYVGGDLSLVREVSGKSVGSQWERSDASSKCCFGISVFRTKGQLARGGIETGRRSSFFQHGEAPA